MGEEAQEEAVTALLCPATIRSGGAGYTGMVMCSAIRSRSYAS